MKLLFIGIIYSREVISTSMREMHLLFLEGKSLKRWLGILRAAIRILENEPCPNCLEPHQPLGHHQAVSDAIVDVVKGFLDEICLHRLHVMTHILKQPLMEVP